MSCEGLVRRAITRLEIDDFNKLRDVLIDNYLPLTIAKKEDLTIPFLAEKINDYFEIVSVSKYLSFEEIVKKYINDLDRVVCTRIEKEVKTKKGEPAYIPRSRRYYDKACELKKYNKDSKRGLIDYSRIMLCLYSSIIKNDLNVIDDFDYSLDGLNLTAIIEAMLKEPGLRKNKTWFDINDPYRSDRCTFVLLVIMFYYIKSNEIVGEY